MILVTEQCYSALYVDDIFFPYLGGVTVLKSTLLQL